jgi:uncharacterized protein (DUF1330 family)
MTKAYWINTFTAVHDRDKVRAYAELAGPAMREAGGKILSRGDAVYAFEGGTLLRTTLIEFPSADVAAAAYTSPGYQAALEALGDGAEREIRIVEALPEE